VKTSKYIVVNANQQQLVPNYTVTISYGKTYTAAPQVGTAVHRYLGIYIYNIL
jgi:hypothetical protein